MERRAVVAVKEAAMSRKNKGAALFELLHRDKGKATTADGSLKLPSWFRTKAQPAPPPSDQIDDLPPPPARAQQPAGQPPAPADPSPGKADEKSAAGSQPPAAASQSPAAAGQVKPPPLTGGSTRLTTGPSPASGGAAQTPKLVPPWATGPWLLVSNGRVRVNVTTFAAYVVLGVLACTLAIAFFLGRATVRPRGPEQTAAPAAAPKDVESARNAPADPNILNVGGDAARTAVRDGAAGAGDARTGGDSATTGGAHAPPAGNYYVRILAGGTEDGCNKVRDYFREKGFNVVVDKAGRGFGVRTAVGTDETTARELAGKLEETLAKLAAERRGLTSYRPGDPSSKPKLEKF